MTPAPGAAEDAGAVVSVQRHVAVLRSALREGEPERTWIRAERRAGGHRGALLLTDRRLLFSGQAFVGQSQQSWPLPIIESSGVDETGALALRVAGVPEHFTGRPDDLRALGSLLGEPVAPPSRTDAGELERLAALHASGALTAAEFAAAKARLLT